MSVYVDNAQLPFGRMKMSHMIADSNAELIEMAKRIGVDPKWIQKPGTPHEHFDVSKFKRELAIANGAIPIEPRELVAKLNERRSNLAPAVSGDKGVAHPPTAFRPGNNGTDQVRYPTDFFV